MANTLDIIFGVINAAGEVAIENNKKEELKKSFSIAFEEMKAKYNYCKQNRSVVSYDAFTKATLYYTYMKIEGETIISMIPYRTSEESLKLMKNFIEKYQIYVAQEVHVHVHVHETPTRSTKQYDDIFDMFFGK